MTAGVLPIILRDVCLVAGGRPVLNRLSAAIVSAGITAIVGANGAGKSVTLRILDGLLAPDSGTVRFGAAARMAPNRALVFQRPALIRSSVAHNVALALAPLGLGRRDAEARIDAALIRVGLRDRAREPARKLSGGEQQRLALARAWAIEPALLLLDEPTASLDPGATEEIERLTRAMAKDGVKVVLVSHNLGQVARLAEDVIVLAEGRVVEHGPAGQVLSAPRNSAARAYLRGELPWMSCAAAS